MIAQLWMLTGLPLTITWFEVSSVTASTALSVVLTSAMCRSGPAPLLPVALAPDLAETVNLRPVVCASTTKSPAPIV